MRFRRLVLGIVAAFVITSCARGMGLNEIMFDPDGNENTDEFVELYNDATYARSLAGWMISDGEGCDTIVALEQGLFALPHQYVLVLDADYLPSGSTTYDGLVPDSALVVTLSSSTIGSRGLSNSSAETISLIDPQGDTVSTYQYTLGNVEGRSDERILLSAGNDSTNWANAVAPRGSPGGRNSVTPPERDLAVTAVDAEPNAPRPGEPFAVSVSISNQGSQTMSDSVRLLERWTTSIGDSLSLIVTWSIAWLATGDSVVFQQSGLVGSTTPRYFRAELVHADDRLANNRCDLAVSPAGLTSLVVVNEIMYSPDAGMSEWVELANVGLSPVELMDWRLGDGTALADTTRCFILPQVTLFPDSYVVIAADSSIFFEALAPSAQVLIWGTSNISLNNNGDSLVLWDRWNSVVERVDYRPSWGGETGKSAERVSRLSPTNNPLNWATSLDSTGGTPGRVNTRSLPAGQQTYDVLTLEPNPFSPDGDGHDDLLALRYSLEQADSRLDIKIYDIRGREVLRLADNTPAGFGGEILWDGRDKTGRELPTGVYVIYLEAFGNGGTRIQTARRVVALARPA